MGTKKGSKVIIKNVIGPFEGPKMVFNLCQFLQFGANFKYSLLEGPKSALIVNGNLETSEDIRKLLSFRSTILWKIFGTK